jgi:hypothetical protein
MHPEAAARLQNASSPPYFLCGLPAALPRMGPSIFCSPNKFKGGNFHEKTCDPNFIHLRTPVVREYPQKVTGKYSTIT